MQEIKSVLVTGGAQGIGAAIASRFAELGYAVIILDYDDQAGKARQQKIIKNGGLCKYIQVDIKEEEEVRQAFLQLEQEQLQLDVLVNNAGISKATPLEGSLTDWEEVVFTNLRGAYVVTKYAKAFLKKGSAIINISSTRALMSETDWHGYAASKGGINGLTHSLAVTLGAEGIRVNAISPGWIDVSGWQQDGEGGGAALREIDHAQHPAGRVGKPEDIAAACVFLSSEEAGFITGANLVIDGGMTVKMMYAE